MYLVVVAWIYVVGMMALAEAVSPSGTWLGAIATLLLYGMLPLGIVVYIGASPGRRHARRAAEAAARAAAIAGAAGGATTATPATADAAASAASAASTPTAAPSASAATSAPPDAGHVASADAVAAVREKP